VASLFCLALGLLAKPMIVTLPVLLCVLDDWPLRRRVRIVDKLPFLLVAISSAVATLLAQAGFGNTQLLEPVSLPIRLANAAITAVIYLWQTIWPADLACFYPYPRAWLESNVGILTALSAAAVLVAIIVICALLRRRFRWLLAGWLWYLVALAPVIGIVQVGRQSHADRYTYLPSIGLSWIVAWGVVMSVRSAPAMARSAPATARAMAASLAVVAVGWLAFLSAQQTTYWRDDLTLWTHTLAVTADNEIAHQNLGAVYLRANRTYDAIPHLEESLRLRAGAAETNRNLGLAYEALAYRDQAAGQTAEAADRFAKAEQHFAAAARLRPDWPLALESLSWFYLSVPDARFDRPQDAVRLAEQLVRITGDQGLIQLAMAQAAAGNRDAAVAALDRYRTHLLQGNPRASTVALDNMRKHIAAGGTVRNRHQADTPKP
jgi:tetratricopeptide (TPR) repeat protein